MLVARPPVPGSQPRDLHLVRAVRRTFTGSAEFLADPRNRDRVGEYLADLVAPYGLASGSTAGGQSYAEMAHALIGLAVPAAEPVDLLVLAFSVHDLRPSQQAAAYLSHLTPGAPMAFAICDQGSAAGFSGLRIAGEYVSSAGIRRALLIVVEQAVLPYPCAAPLPARHQGVAMLYAAAAGADTGAGAGAGAGAGLLPWARVTGVRQHPAVSPADAAAIAAADLTELAAGHRDVRLVLGAELAAIWTAPGSPARVMPPGQPLSGVWSGLVDEADRAPRPGLLVAADYDPGLRYLCLAAFSTGRP